MAFYERSQYVYENKASLLQNELSLAHHAGVGSGNSEPFALRITGMAKIAPAMPIIMSVSRGSSWAGDP
jgi:hypothetical protein